MDEGNQPVILIRISLPPYLSQTGNVINSRSLRPHYSRCSGEEVTALHAHPCPEWIASSKGADEEKSFFTTSYEAHTLSRLGMSVAQRCLRRRRDTAPDDRTMIRHWASSKQEMNGRTKVNWLLASWLALTMLLAG